MDKIYDSVLYGTLKKKKAWTHGFFLRSVGMNLLGSLFCPECY